MVLTHRDIETTWSFNPLLSLSESLFKFLSVCGIRSRKLWTTWNGRKRISLTLRILTGLRRIKKRVNMQQLLFGVNVIYYTVREGWFTKFTPPILGKLLFVALKHPTNLNTHINQNKERCSRNLGLSKPKSGMKTFYIVAKIPTYQR